MKECAFCDDTCDLPFECNYCGGVFCESHRLPEGHDCDGVSFLSGTGKRFKSKTTNEVVRTDDEIQRPEPISPKYTVGDRPAPEFESSPDVTLKEDTGPSDEPNSHWLKKLLGFFR